MSASDPASSRSRNSRGCSVERDPAASATASSTRSASTPVNSTTTTTPSICASRLGSPCATRRDFPTPPGTTTETTRSSATASSNARSSRARPTKVVESSGRPRTGPVPTASEGRHTAVRATAPTPGPTTSPPRPDRPPPRRGTAVRTRPRPRVVGRRRQPVAPVARDDRLVTERRANAGTPACTTRRGGGALIQAARRGSTTVPGRWRSDDPAG